MADSCGPAVVHCSAGVGRTAVLLAVDIGLQGILQGDARIDVLRVVSTLRQDRAGLVQTKDQYRFIHQVSTSLPHWSSATIVSPLVTGSVRLKPRDTHAVVSWTQTGLDCSH